MPPRKVVEANDLGGSLEMRKGLQEPEPRLGVIPGVLYFERHDVQALAQRESAAVVQGCSQQQIPHLIPGKTELRADRAGDPRNPKMVTHNRRRYEVERR